MYIFKNAFRCIGRAKSRNILIGIIVFAISLSACIGLSIRHAAANAKEDTLSGLSITANISFDRRSAMQNMTSPEQGTGQTQERFDKQEFSQLMGENSALSLEEYEKYSKASTVKDFYYTSTVSVNGKDLEPVSNEEETENQTSSTPSPSGNMNGKRDFIKGAQSDFSLIGVSGENAMTDFINGTATVTEGEIFQENTEENHCIISSELATFNNISVGDKIVLTNPNSEEETYTMTVTGIFTDTSANENSFSMMGMTSNDPANKIYISYHALEGIIAASEEASVTITDSATGDEQETALRETLTATYTFADVEAYNTFETDVRDMGLDEKYTVSSPDITQFENSLAPLNTLSKTAGYFLIVILCIGAVILVVLNIFSVRERKYEIGVRTAMGMKKGKVALQFLTEIFAVTLAAVIIGGSVGAVASVPVANTLLKSQIESSQSRQNEIEKGFGRGGNVDTQGEQPPEIPSGFGGRFETLTQNTAEYVDEISNATDFTVLLQLLGIAIVLTVIAGAFSVLFIMRYEPLKILSNRD